MCSCSTKGEQAYVCSYILYGNRSRGIEGEGDQKWQISAIVQLHNLMFSLQGQKIHINYKIETYLPSKTIIANKIFS